MDCFCPKSRVLQFKIILLDERELFHEVQSNELGQAVLDYVFEHLNLLETAYFGLRYLDQEGQTHWLDPSKKLGRQFKTSDTYFMYFGIKFYAADPCKLVEEITRYQFFLQIKQDILQGRLPVPFELAAELGAYIVQSELGDFDPRRHSPGYVSEFRFFSNQSLELESRIAEIHMTLVGQVPSVAELNYLDKVKWLEMYGVDLHPVLGEDNVEYFLGLTPSGIVVLRNKNTVGNYYWPRISKIYFKGKYFMLRVTDKNNDENTYGFETPSKPACKHLWKCCVEHHAFFRLVQVTSASTDIFTLGSKFRYSGRTEKQAVKDAQMHIRNPPTFSRTRSKRYQRRILEDGVIDVSQIHESMKVENYNLQDIKHVSVPQPAQLLDNSNRSACNPMLDTNRSDSPRSTKSVPWTQPHSRGLYNIPVPLSPRSVRSAGPRCRSSSVDSQSSNDSRSCRRRKHKSRIISDNESELSKCSGRSHRKHRRHRSRGNKRDSSSEQDSQHPHKHSRSKYLDGHYELIDSGSQWREIQRRQTEGAIQQASVISNCRSGFLNNGLETESEASYHHRVRKHRKHRSRSRSPSNSKSWLSEELKMHLEFDLIDTSGMTESQLREIPYTVVQTNQANQLKLKHTQKSKHNNNDKSSNSPPPPYSPQIMDTNRIKGMRVNNFSSKGESSSNTAVVNSNMLPRMFDSLIVSDNQRKIQTSSLHGDPPCVSHEHTDSGLGVEQDGSERSNESAKVCNANIILSENHLPVSNSSNPYQLYPSGCDNLNNKLIVNKQFGVSLHRPLLNCNRQIGSRINNTPYFSYSCFNAGQNGPLRLYYNKKDTDNSYIYSAQNNNKLTNSNTLMTLPSATGQEEKTCNSSTVETTEMSTEL